MPRIRYVDKKFNKEHQAILVMAHQILSEYAQEGFTLTLRQLFYQFVARGYIANRQSEYKRLSGIISAGRLAGVLDWAHMEDRTRQVRGNAHWEGPEDLLESAAESFHLDLWEDQPFRVEVWIEKDALVGVVEGMCRQWDVPLFSCRGYTSQSEMWSAGHNRLRRYGENGQRPIILHLGDHDPSGIDMTRDIEERLSLFAQTWVEVKRIALNMPQIEEYQPPPNPAKLTDTRAGAYVAEHGYESWELDALSPTQLNALVNEEIEAYIDPVKFDDKVEAQQLIKDQIAAAGSHWGDVIHYLDKEGLL